MDYLHIVGLTMSILAYILTMASQSQAFSPGQLLSSKNSSISSSSSSSQSSSSSTSSGTEKKKCCENGGLCVMGVFCHCPVKFYGFRCEHEMRPCGPVEHAQWARVGCNLCRCFDAQLTCLPHVYGGCDDKPINEDIDIADYQDDMEIFPNDDSDSRAYGSGGGSYDDSYYYNYDDGYTYDNYDDNGGHKKSCAPRHHFDLEAGLWHIFILFWIMFFINFYAIRTCFFEVIWLEMRREYLEMDEEDFYI